MERGVLRHVPGPMVKRAVALGAVLGVAGLTGCTVAQRDCVGFDGAAHLTVHSDFPDLELAAMDRAADRWEAFAGRRVVELSRGNDDSCTVLRAYVKSLTLPDGTTAIARYDGGAKVIEVAEETNCHGDTPGQRDLACLETVMMHEMGHVLGLSHLRSGVDGIMRGSGGTAADFTPADHEACVVAGVCAMTPSL